MADRQGSNSGYRPTEPEQRLIDYIRAGTLDAEIAVRMGVPVGDVKDRIASLVYKLNLHSRADLATWTPQSTPPAPPDADPTDGEPEAPLAAPVHTRRSMLASALAGAAAVAAGGAGLFWLSRPSSRGTDGRTPSPSSTTTTPSPADGPPGTGISAIVPSPDAFDRYSIKAGTPITAEQGLFFMNTKGGDIEGWRLRASIVQDYDVNPDNTYVVAHNRTQGTSYIADRRTGNTYSWPSDELYFVAASRTVLLFEEASTATTQMPGAGNGRYHLLDSNFELLRSFTVDDPPAARSTAVFSPDAADILLWRYPQDSTGSVGAAEVWHVEASSGSSGRISGGMPFRQPYFLLDGGDVLLPFTFANQTKLIRITWQGRTISEVTYPSSEVYPSPSGRYMAWEEQLPLSGTLRGETWPSVVIASTDGAPLFRIRSASLIFGDNLAATRWLPDSSGVVVQIRDDSATTTGGLPPVAYAVLQVGDGAVVPLPPLPQGEPDWFNESRIFGPAPAPEGTLISFGRLAVLDRAAGAWIAQPSIPAIGPAQLPPWGITRDEMRFALPSIGHSDAPVHVLLNPKRDDPPFQKADTSLVVARTGDWLNLRAAPDLGAPVIGRLPDGTRLEPEPAGQMFGSVVFNDSGVWVRVRRGDSGEAWVSAAYLDWHQEQY